MTCIVAVIDKENKRVVMGADSAGVSGLDISVRKDPKIFKNGPFLIGCTGSFRMMQLLNYSFKPPKVTPKEMHKYMCTDFIDEIRECFRIGGFLQKFEEGDDKGGCFLVAYKDNLFQIAIDFQVEELHRGYDAIGCGSDYALGALFGWEVKSASPRVKHALKAAEYFSAGVREPFNILST